MIQTICGEIIIYNCRFGVDVLIPIYYTQMQICPIFSKSCCWYFLFKSHLGVLCGAFCKLNDLFSAYFDHIFKSNPKRQRISFYKPPLTWKKCVYGILTKNNDNYNINLERFGTTGSALNWLNGSQLGAFCPLCHGVPLLWIQTSLS